jgi:hypothetical protein
MSMSDPFLPVPPESEADYAEKEIDAVEDDEQPDVLRGAPDDDESGPTERDAGAFRTPHVGDRLSPDELRDDLA